ncbi:reverse transcriptase domain-containing protein [Tanacetum coccineum]|uniref:Reverse transcriptase domain-containing protein n=1 Tax=Tanacetum coccineum TaxID=301880 RepID=A0ABQ5HJR8_9ASTR
MFPSSLTNSFLLQKPQNIRNAITNFQQRFDESFCEAWDRFKDLLRACPHHGFTELHQLVTFYNSLTSTDQDSLNAAASGNLLTKTPKDALTIIENKSKVLTSRNRPVVAKVSTNTSTFGLSPDVAAFTDAIKALLLKKTLCLQLPLKRLKRVVLLVAMMLQQNNKLENMLSNYFQMNKPSSLGSLPSNTVVNPKGDLKAITIRSGVSYDGPPIPPPFSPYPKVVEREPEVTKDPMHPIVDYVVDPRVPLILGRPFLRTARALIDVYGEELTLQVSDETITFKVGNTSRYSYNDAESINRIDVIYIACQEYSQEVLGFSDNSEKEIEAYLASDSVLPGIDNAEFNPEGDIRLIEEMLSKDPYSPLPLKDLKREELKSVKSSVDEPPELELKDLPSHLEYAFLEGTNKLPVIIAKNLKDEEKERLIKVLKSHKQAIAWKLSDIKGIDPQFCTHKILMEDDFKPAVQHQRRVNPKIHEVIKKEVVKLLDAGLIYPISDSPWVSPVHCVPKKGGMTVVTNEDNELIPTRLVTGWRVCIDYRKLNDATRKDHFPLPFMDQMLERLAGNEYYCFLDGFSRYFQIPIDPQDQEKTTFTCPYGTFAYRCMPFGLCNAPGTFQRCMMAIFHDMIEETMEVFMDDFSEKCHFMVKEDIVLGHKISKSEIEVDRAKVDVIAKLPPPTSVKGIRSFLGHAGEAFETLKKKLTEAPILVAPDWDLPFEIMCDASDFAVGAVLGQRKTKHFQSIHYASKTMTDAQAHYTTTEKELLAVVYAFEKFRPYLVLSKTIVYTDHSALKYLLAKQDTKPRLLCWILLLQEFDVIIHDKKKGAENLPADHLSRLENSHQSNFEKKEITKKFPLKTLGIRVQSDLGLSSPVLDICSPLLGMVTFRGDANTPWFADIANYHARNFIVKEMSSQQKNKFFKDVKHYF